MGLGFLSSRLEKLLKGATAQEQVRRACQQTTESCPTLRSGSRRTKEEGGRKEEEEAEGEAESAVEMLESIKLRS